MHGDFQAKKEPRYSGLFLGYSFEAFLLFSGLNPVPTGISFPIITFSFNPLNLSSLPSKAALISTLEVCWKEAADKNDSEFKATSEIPSKILELVGASFFFSFSS